MIFNRRYSPFLLALIALGTIPAVKNEAIGSIMAYPVAKKIPAGYLHCDGREVQRQDYP